MEAQYAVDEVIRPTGPATYVRHSEHYTKPQALAASKALRTANRYFVVRPVAAKIDRYAA